VKKALEIWRRDTNLLIVTRRLKNTFDITSGDHLSVPALGTLLRTLS